nr:ribosomal-processing cysteine protease Prp [uncultured Cellulosilyticum sp.]
MIKVIYDGEMLRVQGHAGYAPEGQDIVCAAISVLTTTFINAAVLYECDINIVHNEKGLIDVEFTKTDETLNILLNTYFIGVDGVAEQYPKYVEVLINEAK